MPDRETADGDTVEVSHVESILDVHEEVARDLEFGHIHDPDSAHGDDHPNVRSDYLDAEECFACRRCWGYPGTEEQLDEILGESSTPDQPEGQESLARWSA